MTVIDSSAVVTALLETEAEVASLVAAEGELAAPDLVVFEVLAVLRRMTMRRLITHRRAAEAISDLGDFPLSLFPSMPLRFRSWELRENLTAGDGLFVALAERLCEPLVTRDLRLAGAVDAMPAVEVRVITAPQPL